MGYVSNVIRTWGQHPTPINRKRVSCRRAKVGEEMSFFGRRGREI
jgi:hypothetical protein